MASISNIIGIMGVWLMSASVSRGQIQIPRPADKMDTSLKFNFSGHPKNLFLGHIPLVKMVPLPGDLYTRNFGFFCRQELKMYKAHVPLSFRLGSMENCNRLEGK